MTTTAPMSVFNSRQNMVMKIKAPDIKPVYGRPKSAELTSAARKIRYRMLNPEKEIDRKSPTRP